jgi:hypothetical protein
MAVFFNSEVAARSVAVGFGFSDGHLPRQPLVAPPDKLRLILPRLEA